MNRINPTDIKTIEDVRLNHEGKIIGQIIRYKGEFYYRSYRTGEHYFIKFDGFGVDSALFKKLIDRTFNEELQKKMGVNRYLKGIIIEYKGKKEHRFYFANLDTWLLNGIDYGTAKQTDSEIESYGKQLILPKKFMTVLGVFSDDVIFKEKIGLERFS